MKLSIRAKLIGSYALLLVLTIAMGLTGMWAEGLTQQNYLAAIEQSLPVSALVYKVRSEVLEKGIAVRGFMISLDEANIVKFYDIDKIMMDTLDTARRTFDNAESHEYLDEIARTNDAYNDLVDEVVAMTQVGQTEAAMAKLAAGAQQLLAKADSLIAAWGEFMESANQQWIGSAKKAGATSSLVRIIGIGVSVVTMIIIAVSFNRSVAVATVKIKHVAEAVAAGDLTIPLPSIKTGDEIQALNDAVRTMVANLTRLLGEMRAESDNVARRQPRAVGISRWNPRAQSSRSLPLSSRWPAARSSRAPAPPERRAPASRSDPA